MNEASDELFRLNAILSQHPEKAPLVEFNGRPQIRVFSLDEASFERFTSFYRAPHLVGDFAVRGFLIQEARNNKVFPWIVFQAGNDMYGHRLASASLLNRIGAIVTNDTNYERFER